ncbi:MAG: GspH/FimT family pseudopilin [Burkholderiales bacterium]|nr:GspH/FimT family pseudopilin [Burkholderiales bacterium]
MKVRQSGFTLVELMVVVTIAVVLLSLAAPSFRSMLVKRSVQSAADILVSDLRYARSEALKRSSTVIVCNSLNGSSCMTLCSPAVPNVCAPTASWKGGWIVFADGNSNGAVDAGEILRVQDALPSMASIASTNPANDRLNFVYLPSGWARASSQTFILTPDGAAANAARVVCISSQGRAALKAEGATSCV